MTGTEWLEYFLADQQKKRKGDWLDTAGTALGAGAGFLVGGPPGTLAGAQLGGAAGGLAEGAVNKELTPMGALGTGMRGVSGFQGLQSAMGNRQAMDLLRRLTEAGFPMGFANGGMVPPPEMMAEVLRRSQGQQAPTGFEDLLAEPTPPTPPQYAQASHPGWEAALEVLGEVMSRLPAPRATASSNKTVGAYTPALGAGLTAAAKIPARRRGEKNANLAAGYEQQVKDYSQSARDLAGRRWDLYKAKMGIGEKSGAEGLTPEQYDALNVPKEYRTEAGFKAWTANRQRNDMNLNRLQIRAAQTKDIKDFPEIRDAYGKIRDFASGDSGVSDMALVFAYMRILDPTSVVREGEYERAVKTSSIPDWLWNLAQKAMTGVLLNPKQREQMVKTAGMQFERKRNAYRRARSWVDSVAKNYYGLDPQLVIPNLEDPGAFLPVSQAQPEPMPTDHVDDHGVPVPMLTPADGGKPR